MVWVDNIQDLEYYSPNGFWECYEDTIFQPNDILLQAAQLIAPVGSGYTIQINVLTPDGVTVYEDATSDFDYFFAYVTLSGKNYYYCNIRLNTYSSSMLAHGCFILQVTIKDATTSAVIFNKYTQKYFIGNSNPLPGGVTVEEEGQSTNLATQCGQSSMLNRCGDNFIQFSSVFDCIDTFSGDYYGNPTTVLSGAGTYPFDFIKISNIKGRLKKLPREIKRTVSINCRTQKTETTPKYSLLGDVVFPIWKVDEIENMMLANHLYVDGKQYQSEGGTPFSQFGKPQGCQYAYQLNMDLQDCYEFQIFGCSPVCSSQTYYYPITQDDIPFFDDVKRLVANDISGLRTYLASLPDVVSVTSVPFQLPCQLAAVLQVKTQGNAPKYLHQQFAIPSYRIYPKILPENATDLSSLCGAMPLLPCDNPFVGTIYFESVSCEPPGIGGITSISDAFSYTLTVTGENGWSVSSSSANNINGLVTFSLAALNNTYTGSTIQNYLNETIATISDLGKPVTAVFLTHDDNSNIPVNVTIGILPTGEIQYSGPATSQGQSGSGVTLTDISYKIQLQ